MKLARKNNLFVTISALTPIVLSACNSGSTTPSSANDSQSLINLTSVPANWNLLGKIDEKSRGDNFVGAWGLLKQYNNVPGESVTVAVIDTGYTPHSNFINKLQSYGNPSENKYGYQFISSCFISNESQSTCTIDSDDTISYRLDGLDLGDFREDKECSSEGSISLARASTWHGTHVTGTIIGQGQESMDGGAYGAKVVPIRVLGKCGGTDSDISNAIMWAIGQDESHPNPHPADIINMSLGGRGVCPQVYQEAINAANESGVIVVVAAGNSSENVSEFTPANCSGVISVAALSHDNTAAHYTNYGNITIAASGGGGYKSQGVFSTIWNSKKRYDNSEGGGYGTKSGTSMAAPGVTAAIADIISLLKAKDIKYTPADIKKIITDCSYKDFKRYYDDPNKIVLSPGRLDVGSAIQCVINQSIPTNK